MLVAQNSLGPVCPVPLTVRGTWNCKSIATIINYANTLFNLQRFEEARTLMRKYTPVARRVLGEDNEITLKMRLLYAGALFVDASATLDDLRESVTTLEDAGRIARRVFGGAHPMTKDNEAILLNARVLLNARAALRARETPSGSA